MLRPIQTFLAAAKWNWWFNLEISRQRDSIVGLEEKGVKEEGRTYLCKVSQRCFKRFSSFSEPVAWEPPECQDEDGEEDDEGGRGAGLLIESLRW